MCVKKALYTDKTALEHHYNVKVNLDWLPTKVETAFEFGYSPIITSDRPDIMQLYRWGSVPGSETDQEKIRNPKGTVNCRSETMYELPSFRGAAIQHKRCIIPATAIFESHYSSVTKAKPKNIIPYKIFAKDQEIFSMAGLFSYHKNKVTGEEIHSFTIITTVARGLFRKIHNNPSNPHRMPVVLSSKALEKAWLNKTLTQQQVMDVCNSMPEDFLTAYTVSKAINNPRMIVGEKYNVDIDKPVYYAPEEIDEPERFFN